MTKSATRQELADAMGVSVRTFTRWLRPHMAQLKALGYQKNMVLLPPPVTRYICKVLAIEYPKEEDS